MTCTTEDDALVAGLNALHDLDRAKAMLVARGPAVIPALERYLCGGRPAPVFESRRAAVEVLADLGARAVLMDYLAHPRVIIDPVVRQAEQAVENAAARALARWRTPEVFAALMAATRRGPRAGLVDALAAFDCLDPIPYYLAALENSLTQAPAFAALERLGNRAEWPLLGAARTQLPSAEWEHPSSLERRCSALRLLANIGPSPGAWPWLRPLLESPSARLSILAGSIAVVCGTSADHGRAAARALECLDAADWFLQGEIADLLQRLHPVLGGRLDLALDQQIAILRSTAAGRSHQRAIVGLLLSLRSGWNAPVKPSNA